MDCPACGATAKSDGKRQLGPNLTKRYYQCANCGKRFSSWEEVDSSLILVLEELLIPIKALAMRDRTGVVVDRLAQLQNELTGRN